MTPTTLDVLLLEDNPGDVALVRSACAGGVLSFRLTVVERLEAALQQISSNHFDVILTDLGLPDSDGLDTLRSLLRAVPRTPIIVFTGLNDEETGLQAIREGAQDYLTKGEISYELARRAIRYALERKRIERALQERTTELAALNQELDAFTHTVAHDLYAPIKRIHLFSEELLAKSGPALDETARERLQWMIAEAKQLEQLIRSLLSFSRAKQSALKRQRVDLSALVHLVAAYLQRLDPQRQVNFLIAPGLQVYGDETLLLSLLNNLLGNAWKFTRFQQQARIEVDSIQQAGMQVYFVRDNGVGFDMDSAGRLFQPFQRLHSSADYPGSGIGLATSKKIVERHDGKIWVESAPNSGTTVFFSLSEEPPVAD